MGWCPDYVLMEAIIDSLVDHKVSKKTRKAVYADIIPAFQRFDWDTETECLELDTAFDEALRECDPELFGFEEDEWEDDVEYDDT